MTTLKKQTPHGHYGYTQWDNKYLDQVTLCLYSVFNTCMVIYCGTDETVTAHFIKYTSGLQRIIFHSIDAHTHALHKTNSQSWKRLIKPKLLHQKITVWAMSVWRAAQLSTTTKHHSQIWHICDWELWTNSYLHNSQL